MNVKQKLGYMLIGCLFTIAGYILASLGGGAAHAQQNEQVLDKIVCRELEVVNTEGTPVVRIGAAEEGGVMSVINAAGKTVGAIGASGDGGAMGVFNAAAGKGGFRIHAAKGSGAISVINAAGKTVGIIGATEDGSGIIQIYDEDGWRTH